MDQAVARIHLAVSDVSLNENWHWELTVHHEGFKADEVAGQAPSHILAADAAEQAYARILSIASINRKNSTSEDAPREAELGTEAFEQGSDA